MDGVDRLANMAADAIEGVVPYIGTMYIIVGIMALGIFGWTVWTMCSMGKRKKRRRK